MALTALLVEGYESSELQDLLRLLLQGEFQLSIEVQHYYCFPTFHAF
jgi:hypothetical protein